MPSIPPHPDAAQYGFNDPVKCPYFNARGVILYEPSRRAAKEAFVPSRTDPSRHIVSGQQIIKTAFFELCHLWWGLVAYPPSIPTKPWDGVLVMNRQQQCYNILLLDSRFSESRRPPPEAGVLHPHRLQPSGRVEFGIPDYLIDRVTDGLPAWQRYSAYVSAGYEYSSHMVLFQGWALPDQVRTAPRDLQRKLTHNKDGTIGAPVDRMFAHIYYDKLFPMRTLFEQCAGFDYESLKDKGYLSQPASLAK
jgi:hypothetical protein